jgi:hypothetical protein
VKEGHKGGLIYSNSISASIILSMCSDFLLAHAKHQLVPFDFSAAPTNQDIQSPRPRRREHRGTLSPLLDRSHADIIIFAFLFWKKYLKHSSLEVKKG